MSSRRPGWKDSLRGIWGEHGAWAVVLSCYAAGLIVVWPPKIASLLLLPAIVLLTGGKGLAQEVRRTGRGWTWLVLFGLMGGVCALPTALAAPWGFLAAACLSLPFLGVYFLMAGSPRLTRSLVVELYGTALLGTVSGLAYLGTRPASLREAALTWPLFTCLFLPGVLRARLPKAPSPLLRSACIVLAAAGAGLIACYCLIGRLAPWGAFAGLVLLEDIRGALVIPRWTTRRLGMILTFKNAFACLVLAASWLAA